jgi:hypothetical protein
MTRQSGYGNRIDSMDRASGGSELQTDSIIVSGMKNGTAVSRHFATDAWKAAARMPFNSF